VNRDLEQEIAELVTKPRRIAGIESGEGLVGLFEEVRPQRCVRLLAVPRAPVRCAEPFGDAHHGVDGRQIGEGLERGEDEKPSLRGVSLGVGQRRRAVGLQERDRMGGGVARAQQDPIDRSVERDRDRAQRRERMPVEAARWDEIDTGGPALEQGGERRRATRTRGQG